MTATDVAFKREDALARNRGVKWRVGGRTSASPLLNPPPFLRAVERVRGLGAWRKRTASGSVESCICSFSSISCLEFVPETCAENRGWRTADLSISAANMEANCRGLNRDRACADAL
jgi:hypothetical protein